MKKIMNLSDKLKYFVKKYNTPLKFLILFTVTATCFGGLLFFLKKSPVIQKITTKIENKNEPPPYVVDVFSDEKTIVPPFEMPKIEQPQFPDSTCPITDYGAIGDGKTLDTKAFLDAISDCSKKGGGIVEVPEGKWLTGAIKITDNINLHLDKNSEIIFSSNLNDYLPAVFSRYEGIEYIGYSPFIYGENCSNVAITGEGKLEGQGKLWWPKYSILAHYSLYDMAKDGIPVEKRVFAKEDNLLGPSFVQFANCNSVLLENFTIQNSPQWTIHPFYSSNIIIRNITINTLGLNNDGIDIDSSRNVLIENSTITSGDDAIAIKSGRDKDGLRVNKPSENVVIRNCNILAGHGGVAIGSEVSGGINNVFAYNIRMDRTTFGLRLKSSIGRGGTVENIWANNIIARRVDQDAIQITTHYDSPYDESYTALPTMRNIFIDNFTTDRSGAAIDIMGLVEKPIENVSFKNIMVSSVNGVTVSYAKNTVLDDLNIKSSGIDPLFTFSNSENITLANSQCSLKLIRCLDIHDGDTSGIVLKNSSTFSKRTIFENGATKDSISIE